VNKQGQGALFQDHILCKWRNTNCTMFWGSFLRFWLGP